MLPATKLLPANSRARWFFLISCSVYVGCNPAAHSATTDRAAQSPGGKVLEQMAATYRTSTSYADAGELQLRIVRNGETFGQNWPYSVSLVRPNKLRIQCYDAVIVSNGKQILASVAGAQSQVLSSDAPTKLSVDDLVRDDEVIRELQDGGPAGLPPQPALLLKDDTIKDLLADCEGTPALLEPQEIDGRSCDRVEIKKAGGRWTYWVDRETHTLKRVEMPIDSDLRKDVESEGPVSDIALVMEFTGARLNEKLPDAAFQFEVPKDAQLVKRLVRAVRPTAPSELLGKTISSFTFTDLDGKQVTKESLAGKIVVVDFWFRGCQPCSQTMPLLEQVYQKFKDNDRVVFLAVNALDHKDSAADLRGTIKQWGSQIPIARDTSEYAAKTFQATAFPAWFVIGTDGVVQDQEAAINPELPTQLSATLDKLLAGENVYDDVRSRYEQRVKSFEESIKLAQNDTPAGELPIAKPADKSEPTAIKLTKLWTCTELKQPGNILVVPQASGPARLLALDGWRTVAEIGVDGKLVEKKDLTIPEDAVLTTLRTAIDSHGKRFFVGFANGQRQLHVFDDQWKLLTSYPKDEQLSVFEAQFVDFRGDGQLQLCVGYWEKAGVQAVSLTGERLWSNRTVDNVLRLAMTGPDANGKRHVLCVNGPRGCLTPLDEQGQPSTDVTFRDRAIQGVAAADLDGDGTPELCAWGPNATMSVAAVGFGANGKELWSYPLPTGVYPTPVEIASSGKLLPGDKGQWVFAGADGSIHIVSASGEAIDHFNYGATLTGIAVTTIDGKPVLLVATGSGIDAWQVEKR